jgi:hypothetical protein
MNGQLAVKCGFGILVSALLFFLITCGGGGGDENGGWVSVASTPAVLGTLCGPRFDYAGSGGCTQGSCTSGVVSGSALDIGSMTFNTRDKMCTKVCNTDADCQGISFTQANKGTTVATQSWTCLTTSTGKYCAVSMTIPSSGGDSCSGCGGAFCSGNCIGCPQCH